MGSAVISCLVYRDANAMIEWLRTAFGFAERVVYRNDQGVVEHAELTLGDGMVMLGNRRDSEFSRLMGEPGTLGAVTQSAYLVVADAYAALARVQAAGGSIVSPLRHDEAAGDQFVCRDPEGHLWCVGTYDPWQAAAG
ncbi:glyoxalase [Verticiella sediminum]|uniref:Glyoxalase n=1 Tax=Verticiella sediminum TaxID=1247510 RepID=A0A556AYK2_9BURK|nr:VOC family protein [Verticiella sediminum]TSH98019.1 glyoxalase [Verticiella sediminum]